MREFETGGTTYKFQWASDRDFDGLRLEAVAGDEVILDVSVPEQGPVTVNTFGREAPADLITAALEIAQRREAPPKKPGSPLSRG